MNSLERLVRILDQFDEPPGLLTAEHLHDALGYSRSTLYRYLKVLTDAGLLASFHGTGFALGPRIIELNALLVSRDPLIVASAPLMEALAVRFHGTSILCRRFRDKVLCIHQVAEEGVKGPAYQVGKARSLVTGAPARVILAHVGASQLRRLYPGRQAAFAAAGLGEDLASVRRMLRLIRERGYDCEPCPSNPGSVAVSVPIVDGDASIVGSLSLLLPQSVLPSERVGAIADLVMRYAEQVGHSIGG